MTGPRFLRLCGRVVELGPRPLLMGIVNATPDSFSDAGDHPTLEARVARAVELVEAGADLIDVGGESARGDTPAVAAAEEIERVVPLVERLVGLGAAVSVDTYKPAVAEAAIAAGAVLVNDVSGLRDVELASLCARTGAGLVVMHTRVAPKGTLLDPGRYDDVAADVAGFLHERMAVAIARGVDPEQILLDPGPDFAKTPAQTVAVLRRLDLLHELGRPLLLAISNKDFVGALTGRPPRERLAGTLAAVAHAVGAGAHVLRVHDVAAAADFLRVLSALRGDRELAPDEGLTPDRYPDRHKGLPAAAHNAAGCQPTTVFEGEPTMSAVLDRDELEQSPLADLHLLANELGVDGFRRLRKEELIDAIVARQAGDEPAGRPSAEEEQEEPKKPRRGRRGGRGRGRARDEDGATDEDAGEDEPRAEPTGDQVGEGVVELLANGSGFIRLAPPEPTDDDVYISAAQVKRCELVSGDRVGGPVRPARRSERFPSLIRVDTINGRPADEVAEGTRFEDLPAVFPRERFELGSEDPTVKAIEWLTPFGKGSRVVIAGPARAGKSEALRRLAGSLAGLEGLELSLVLAAVRPEEVGEWREGPVEPAAALSFAASSDAQAQAVEQAIEQGRRVAARGGDAVVLIVSVVGLPVQAARRALAAARNIADGGSLTVVATAAAPLGGETTVVALDAALVAHGRFPALDLGGSGVLRPELLVGEVGADAIAKARADSPA